MVKVAKSQKIKEDSSFARTFFVLKKSSYNEIKAFNVAYPLLTYKFKIHCYTLFLGEF